MVKKNKLEWKISKRRLFCYLGLHKYYKKNKKIKKCLICGKKKIIRRKK